MIKESNSVDGKPPIRICRNHLCEFTRTIFYPNHILHALKRDFPLHV